MAEIELAYRFMRPGTRSCIAITGNQRKVDDDRAHRHRCAQASGRPTFCGGNLGNMPMIDAVDHPANAPDGGLVVVEVAAFMLENCDDVPLRHVGVLTNITEDHLDRFEHDGALRRNERPHLGSSSAPTDLAIAQRGRSSG